jgi:thiosulfate dehydrogenase [quinone] large subunit
MVRSFAQTPLPAPLVHAFGVVLTPLELLLGVLVLLGAWLRPALIGATLLMTVLTFGTTLRQDRPTIGISWSTRSPIWCCWSGVPTTSCPSIP